MTDKAYAVPLHELLANVPKSARLVITDHDGKGTRFIPVGRYCHEAAEALRAALAQPEPEPVAWMYNGNLHLFDPSDWADGTVIPLYNSPPQCEWQGLTDEELVAAWDSTEPYFDQADFAKAIEAKLKEKNSTSVMNQQISDKND